MRIRKSPAAAILLAMVCAGGLRAQDAGRISRPETEEDVHALMEFRRAQRRGPDGTVSPDALLRAKSQIDARATLTIPSGTRDAGIWDWESLGPGNIGGRLRAIVVHPADTNKIWLGTAGGGIWRTTDAGASWIVADDFMAALPVASLAIDPISTNILYAGTGEYIGSNSDIPGAGIYKSTDGGITWFQLSSTANPSFHYVSRIAHNPVISGRLLAGTVNGLYSSTDGGGSWTPMLHTGTYAVMDVKYNPANYSRIAVGTCYRDYPFAPGDMFLSSDAGATWAKQTTGDTNKIALSPGRCEIAYAHTNTNIIYVSVGQYGNTGRIWRTTDAGNTWEDRGPTNADPWSNVIWVSPTDPETIFFGGVGDLNKSSNGGTLSGWYTISDWRNYNNGGPANSAHGDQHAIVPHAAYNGSTNRTVFVGNDGGIQKAWDIMTVGPTGWTNLANYLGNTQFFTGAAAPDGSVILGGTQDNSFVVYHPINGPNGWWNETTGDGGFVAVDPVNPQYVYSETQWLVFRRSDNGGTSSTIKINGLGDADNSARAAFISPFLIDPNNPATLVAGGIQIWKTTDRADNWFPIADTIPSKARSTAIDIAKGNSSVIWVGYADGRVYHTTTGGPVWINSGQPAGGVMVTDIAINPVNQNEVIATFGGYTNNTVYITTDGGASWQNRHGTAPNDLPTIQVNTVRYHPLAPNWVYVGTDLGVFASEDKGLTWSVTPRYPGNEGPNNVEVDELFWQGTTYLVAATHGRGMYRCAPLPVVYVDYAYVGTEDGTQFRPYNTVEEAVNKYGPGALVSIKGGTYDGPAMVIDKRGRLISTGGTVFIK